MSTMRSFGNMLKEGPLPYKSNAQRRYFHAAEARGEMPHKTVKEFDKASKGKKLPEKKGKKSTWTVMKEKMSSGY